MAGEGSRVNRPDSCMHCWPTSPRTTVWWTTHPVTGKFKRLCAACYESMHGVLPGVSR